MITLSIKELHAHTGKWVRAAGDQSITVTDRGQPIAELRPLSQKQTTCFPQRSAKDLPGSKATDSTQSIREERDSR